MRYRLEPYSAQHFAANLKYRAREKRLIWDTNQGGCSLLLQGEYGEDFLKERDLLMERLGDIDPALLHQGFQPLGPNFPALAARLIDAREKVQMKGGCPVEGTVHSYLVLACAVSGEECHVFAPRDERGLKKQSEDVSARIVITYEKVYDTIASGFLKRKTEERFAGFYEVKAEEGSALSSYRDGDFYYCTEQDPGTGAGGIRIPIPKLAFEQGPFYIRSDTMPEILSAHKGYRIEMREFV